MVERGGKDADPAHVPTIAALLNQYRDRTGASYDDMSRSIGEAMSGGRLHQLATKPPKNFPDPENVRHLADLLNVSITTILESFAVSLGLDVEQRRPLLAITLPPGTDNLTTGDVAAVRAVIGQLVEARRATAPETPDLSRVEGMRLAEPDEPNATADSQTTR
jgi:hypothetical protein